MEQNKAVDRAIVDAKVKEAFKTPDGQIVDIIFSTSDGELFYIAADAQKHALELANPHVIPHYKGKEVLIRRYMTIDPNLERKVSMVDYLKMHRVKRQPSPTYEQYVDACKRVSMEPDRKVAYDFAVNNIWNGPKMFTQVTEEVYPIYLLNGQQVMAKRLRKYPQTELFIYNDLLIMTCPTHFELMTGNIYQIWAPLMGGTMGVDEDEIG